MYLPIANYRERIVKTVNANQVTIITSPTGSGKTTQVPQYLLEEGYSMVLTQPRRFAAHAVASRIAEETNTVLGGLIGISTRRDKAYSQATRCLVATDGLALMRELVGQNTHDILILDEAHEWNMHTEAMMALAKRAIDKGTGLKLVIMSATIDAERLSEYFDDAPVIVGEGRSFKIVNEAPSEYIVDDAIKYLAEGMNILIFVPGQSEVARTMKDLQERLPVEAMVLPLYAQLSSQAQARCFEHYNVPKCIVATPIAQTSVTIDDIDVVIDSGLENRSELHGGVVGLYERVISFACEQQRRGRVGRTKPGIYVSHAPPREKRQEYPMAEILRDRIDQLVLRLAWQGIDASELDFFHQPSQKVLKSAKYSLRELGCLTKAGKATPKGKRVAELPVSVEAACMLLEAEQRGVLKDMMAIVALYDVGGIVETYRPPKPGYSDKDSRPKETDSDLLSQLALYRGEHPQRDQFSLRGAAMDTADEIYRHLAKVLPNMLDFTKPIGNREDLIASIAAGLRNRVYFRHRRLDGAYHCGDNVERSLHHSSIVKGRGAVVGVPWDHSLSYGGSARNFLCLATKIRPNTLSSLLT